jgi:hypothetical protein
MKSNDQLEPTVFVIFGGAGDSATQGKALKLKTT